MKTNHSPKGRADRREDGTALLIVFILLMLMAIFLEANSGTTHSLKNELNRIERQQLRRWEKRNRELSVSDLTSARLATDGRSVNSVQG